MNLELLYLIGPAALIIAILAVALGDTRQDARALERRVADLERGDKRPRDWELK